MHQAAKHSTVVHRRPYRAALSAHTMLLGECLLPVRCFRAGCMGDSFREVHVQGRSSTHSLWRPPPPFLPGACWSTTRWARAVQAYKLHFPVFIHCRQSGFPQSASDGMQFAVSEMPDSMLFSTDHICSKRKPSATAMPMEFLSRELACGRATRGQGWCSTGWTP